jgi:FAD binding domain/Berberine and berberine like
MMTEKKFLEATIDRRAFLRKGAIGIGMGLVASSRAMALLDPGDFKTWISHLRIELGTANVLVHGDPGYATKGEPANGIYRNIRPAAIALCKDKADVANCVRWCKKYGISPVVRGGGHSYAGYSTTKGLLIDLSRLNEIKIDKHAGTAVVGGAALNRDVRKYTENTEYFLPVGTCLGVGVGGLVLGGGIGYNTRWAGLTSDSLISTTVVTASGDELEANANKNSDLFWACRGGAGGSFGINTSFTFELKKVPPGKVMYFRLILEGADNAFNMFTEFNKLMATSESRINAVARATALSGKRDGIDIMSRGQFIGSSGELEDLLSSYPFLKKHWKVEPMTFWEAAGQFFGEAGEQHCFGDISRYARKPLSDTVISKQIELLRKCPGNLAGDIGPSGSLWSLGWVGGEVMDKFGRRDTAYVHRGEMSTLMRPTCSWPNGDDKMGEELGSWTKEMVELMALETPNESYQNFPNRLIEDWQQQYYAENLARLIEVKTKYDPDNLFNNAQSIPARTG